MSCEARWPDLQEGSVCNQLHRRQRDLQAPSILNGISLDILLKMSLSSKIRENVLLKNIWLMMVSQESVRLKVGVCVFLCLVLIREFGLESPTHLQLLLEVLTFLIILCASLETCSVRPSTCSLPWELSGSRLHPCFFPA